VRARLRIVVLLAVVLAGIDLAVAKATAGFEPGFGHHRSHTWVALSLLDCVFMALLVRIPSRLLAVGSGLLAGGELGNVLWAATHHNVVSNPIVIHAGEGGVAFNIADVFELTGICVIVAALVQMTLRHRHLLPQSTVAVRLVRRLSLALRQ
jgi:hypothetical protein